MEAWISIVSAVLGFLATGSSIVTFILYRKQSVRIKNAEAFEKEVAALRSEIDALKESLKFEREQREKDKEIIVRIETDNTKLHSENGTLEIKNARNKKAINQAYSCGFCQDTANCPVLLQRKKNEEEYLIELQRK